MLTMAWKRIVTCPVFPIPLKAKALKKKELFSAKNKHVKKN